MTFLDRFVTVVEVGPRDGLQNERSLVSTEVKLEFLDRLGQSGLRVIEATAFVSPKAIPQLADARALVKALRREPGVRYPVLVPNEKGLERALEAGVREIAVFTAASETFNRRNINASIDESFQRFEPVIKRAKREGLWIRGYVSCGFGCPYEGPVDSGRTAEVTSRLFEHGCSEVSIGDTIGAGVPTQVTEVLGKILDRGASLEKMAFHFHDTRGTALANVWEALRLGVRIFDSSAGGLGGCPYAPGASGNLATEDLLYLLHGCGFETGVDLSAIFAASRALSLVLGRSMPSRVWHALTSGAVWPPDKCNTKCCK